MSTIISVSNDSSAATGSGKGIVESQAATNKTTAGGEAANTDASPADKDTIELSTRAQKIQKLNEEFFPAGPQSVKITAAFIERLQEYGFLNSDEAKKLSPATFLANGQSANGQAANTLGELSVFIDDFTHKLQDQFPESGLIAVLQKTQSIINNLDGSQPPDTATAIKTVIAELGQYGASDELQSLSSNDQWSLQQLEIALRVADKLIPEGNRSEKINQYLSILNQSV